VERRDASAEANRTVLSGAIGTGARWAAALTVAGLALTGCGAGQHAETSDMSPAIAGVDVDAGALALRDLQVDFGDEGRYPEGGAAPLRVWIANEGTETVVLEAVTSPVAEMVTLATELLVVEPSASADASATPDDDESETPDADESEAPDADESESPDGDDVSASASESESPDGEEAVTELLGEPVFAIEIAPDAHVRLAPAAGSFFLLEGLKEDVTAGSTVEVVFTFSNGEIVTANLPMGDPSESESRSYFADPGDEEAA